MRPHETDEITRGMALCAVYFATHTHTLLMFMGDWAYLNAFLCVHVTKKHLIPCLCVLRSVMFMTWTDWLPPSPSLSPFASSPFTSTPTPPPPPPPGPTTAWEAPGTERRGLPPRWGALSFQCLWLFLCGRSLAWSLTGWKSTLLFFSYTHIIVFTTIVHYQEVLREVNHRGSWKATQLLSVLSGVCSADCHILVTNLAVDPEL